MISKILIISYLAYSCIFITIDMYGPGPAHYGRVYHLHRHRSFTEKTAASATSRVNGNVGNSVFVSLRSLNDRVHGLEKNSTCSFSLKRRRS